DVVFQESGGAATRAAPVASGHATTPRPPQGACAARGRQRLPEIRAARRAAPITAVDTRPRASLEAPAYLPAETGPPGPCPDGGIGRRTVFRWRRGKPRGGSSPLLGTIFLPKLSTAPSRCAPSPSRWTGGISRSGRVL